EVSDLASLVNRSMPQNLVAGHYSGMFGTRLFLDAQYSRRTFTFEHDGGQSRDMVQGTALLDQENGTWYWAPNFCGVCKNETRNNDSFTAQRSYFLSTERSAHDIIFGYDTFNDRRNGENHQSGSDYHIWGTSSLV